jgi:predicted RecA/RadA family phage recombinase
MKNLKRYPNDTIPWTNGTGSKVNSGDVVEIKSGNDGMVAIAETDIADGETGSVRIDGAVRNIAKKTGQSWSQGDKLYWDSSAGKLTTNASSYTYAGRADADAASADTVGDLMINQP